MKAWELIWCIIIYRYINIESELKKKESRSHEVELRIENDRVRLSQCHLQSQHNVPIFHSSLRIFPFDKKLNSHSFHYQYSKFPFFFKKQKHFASNQISSQETRICHSVNYSQWARDTCPRLKHSITVTSSFPLEFWVSLWLRGTTSVSVPWKQNADFLDTWRYLLLYRTLFRLWCVGTAFLPYTCFDLFFGCSSFWTRNLLPFVLKVLRSMD